MPTEELAFSPEFQPLIDAAVARCKVLNYEQAVQFITKGYVVIESAFSKHLADEVCETAWQEMKDEHGVVAEDPGTWHLPFPRGRPSGYLRTKGSGRRLHLKTEAPRAFFAQADVIGGDIRLFDKGEKLHWGDAVIGNLGIPDGREWHSPHPRQLGWHKDGWHFRHFLNSFEQGLLTVPFFSDVLPQSGATFFAQDAIKPVAELLIRSPQGLHPDSVQGSGFLIPGLIEQCSEFRELTGSAGDMALVHPYVLHRVSVNPTRRPRFIANMAVVLREPMKFDRDGQDPYSLAELAVLHALGVPKLNFEMSRPAQAFRPSPFRDSKEAKKERKNLRLDMQTLACGGFVTPEWAEEFGYQSNRWALEN